MCLHLPTCGRCACIFPHAADVPSLVDHFPAPVKSSSDVPEAVEVYRRVLATAADGSVVVAAIGFATNLDALLRSPADAISPLTGKELVAKKVRLVAWQGGWYPPRHRPSDMKSRKPEDEFNWGCGRRWFGPSLEGCEGTAAYASAAMPPNVEQIFSEVGLLFPTGGSLLDCAPPSNPCRQALITTLKEWDQDPHSGRASWDQIVTLMAVRGVAAIGGHTGGEGGYNMIYPNGTNHWREGGGGRQSYLALDGDEGWLGSIWAWAKSDNDVLPAMEEDVRMGRAPPILAELQSEINRLLCMRPAGSKL